MKYLYILLLAAAALTCSPVHVKAQASLGLTTTSVSNSTPALGTQISIMTSLTNVSMQDTFTGIVNFSLANKDSIITNVAIVGYPNFAGTQITLAPQQSRAALFTVQIDHSYFMAGPDIIIVWPIATNAHTIDTAAAPITITWPLGINDPALNNISIFTANDNLIVHNTTPKIGLEQLRIYDLLGNTLITYPLNDATTVVPVNSLPAGLYVAAVYNAAGQFKAVKFVR